MATPISVNMLEKDEKGRNVIRSPEGGVVISKDNVIKFTKDAILSNKIKATLPFKATNMKVSKNQEVLDATDANKIVEKVAPKKRGRPKKVENVKIEEKTIKEINEVISNHKNKK